MTRKRRATNFLVAMTLILSFAPSSHAALMETWEGPMANEAVFTGTGDLTWTGDLAAWAITTATWPTAPAQDFAGSHSLRSANHGSVVGGASVVETVVTNISSAVDFSKPMEWSTFFSGNSITIQPNRRADFILLADTSNVGTIEDPAMLNGYKLTLSDPFANATDNLPPSSHEDAVGLADSLTLWRVTDTDDRWRVIGSIPIGATDDIRDGWNLRARRDVDGTWSIGFANGAIGQIPALTSLGVDAGAPALSVFGGNTHAGVGWTAPNNTAGDPDDFGFDNFGVRAVPEPSAVVLVGLAVVALVNRRRRTDC